MSLFDGINETLEITPPTKSNIGIPIINLIGGEGQQPFIAKWTGDTSSFERKLPEFDFPDIPGTLLQDMNRKSWAWDIEFFFEGIDALDEKKRFKELMDLPGSWTFQHPTEGTLSLFPVSIKIKDEPVESYNLISISGTWLESIPEFQLLEAELNVDSSKAAEGLLKKKPQDFNAFVRNVGKTITDVSKFINRTISTVNKVKTEVEKATVFVQEALTSGVVLATGTMGMVKDLILLPGQLVTSFESSFSFYEQLLMSTINDSVDSIEDGYYNEAIAAFTLFGVAENVNVAEFSNRDSALSGMNRLGSMYNTVLNYSDSLQNQFSSSLLGQPALITDQFSGMLGVFDEIRSVVLSATLKLMSDVYSLRAQRIIVLEKPKTPVEIVITEYGTLGIDYANLDNFIKVNGLRGSEIELLPTGKEVVIYG